MDAGEPRVAALVNGVLAEKRGTGRFQYFGPSGFLLDANTFVRYRILSLACALRTDREARPTFTKYLIDFARRSLPEMQLVLHLINQISPKQVNFRTKDKNPDYEEIALSTKLATVGDFVVVLRHVEGFLYMAQEMGNFICRELVRGKVKRPLILLSSLLIYLMVIGL